MTSRNIELRMAQHVVALAKHRSFTHAAEELGITQSALSRSIQRFEDTVAFRLFDRNRGSVHLTVPGKAMVKRAAALLREAEQFERTVRQLAKGIQENITFGIAHLPARALLAEVMTQELESSPDLDINALVRNSDVLVSMLLREEIEFLICADQLVPEKAPVKSTPIGSFSVAHLVRPGHPLLDKTQARRRDEFPWLLTSTVIARTRAAGPGLSDLREKPQMVIEDMDCLARIAQQTDAIWITCRAAAIRELEDGTLCDIAKSGAGGNAYSTRMMFYSLSDRSLSPAALRLRDRFRMAARLNES